MNHDLWKRYYVLMLIMGSVTFATLNTTLNVSRVTLLPFNRFSLQFMLSISPILLSLHFTNQFLLLIFGLFLIIIVYILFFFTLVDEIATALQIKVFKIKQKN